MRLPLALLLASLSLLGSSGCSVSVPLQGRPCPCDESRGYHCDEATRLCVVSDGRCGVPGAEASPVQILDLRVAWRIDRAAEIRWTVSDEDRESLSHYELVLGTDRSAVASRAEGVTVFDSASVEHPELRRLALPIDGGDTVDRTVLRDLTPDTTYFVSLVAVDGSGAVSCPAPLELRTWLDAPRELVVFDEDPHDSALPLCGIEHVSGGTGASTGTAFTRFVARCPATPWSPPCEEPTDTTPRCFEHVRIYRDDPVSATLGPGAFENVGSLMVDVAIDESEHGYWAELFMITAVPTAAEDPATLGGPRYLWRSPRQTVVADGSYRTYSLPLSQMSLQCFESQRAADVDGTRCNRELTPEDLAWGIVGVRVGTQFDRLGTLRMDNARLRY